MTGQIQSGSRHRHLLLMQSRMQPYSVPLKLLMVPLQAWELLLLAPAEDA